MFDELQKFMKYCDTHSLFSDLRQDVIGRDVIDLNNGQATIDTCYASDIQLYESGVQFGKNVYIVARYPNRESAVAGHADLVSKARANKALTFFDPQDKIIRSIS